MLFKIKAKTKIWFKIKKNMGPKKSVQWGILHKSSTQKKLFGGGAGLGAVDLIFIVMHHHRQVNIQVLKFEVFLGVKVVIVFAHNEDNVHRKFTF